MKLGEVVTTIPTIGFNVETVEYKNVNFNVWYIGGQDKIRPLWRHYYKGVNGVIFVIDSNDEARFPEAKKELDEMLNKEELLKDVFCLVFINKQDLPKAKTPSEVVAALGLNLSVYLLIGKTSALTMNVAAVIKDWVSMRECAP